MRIPLMEYFVETNGLRDFSKVDAHMESEDTRRHKVDKRASIDWRSLKLPEPKPPKPKPPKPATGAAAFMQQTIAEHDDREARKAKAKDDAPWEKVSVSPVDDPAKERHDRKRDALVAKLSASIENARATHMAIYKKLGNSVPHEGDEGYKTWVYAKKKEDELYNARVQISSQVYRPTHGPAVDHRRADLKRREEVIRQKEEKLARQHAELDQQRTEASADLEVVTAEETSKRKELAAARNAPPGMVTPDYAPEIGDSFFEGFEGEALKHVKFQVSPVDTTVAEPAHVLATTPKEVDELEALNRQIEQAEDEQGIRSGITPPAAAEGVAFGPMSLEASMSHEMQLKPPLQTPETSPERDPDSPVKGAKELSEEELKKAMFILEHQPNAAETASGDQYPRTAHAQHNDA